MSKIKLESDKLRDLAKVITWLNARGQKRLAQNYFQEVIETFECDDASSFHFPIIRSFLYFGDTYESKKVFDLVPEKWKDHPHFKGLTDLWYAIDFVDRFNVSIRPLIIKPEDWFKPYLNFGKKKINKFSPGKIEEVRDNIVFIVFGTIVDGKEEYGRIEMSVKDFNLKCEDKVGKDEYIETVTYDDDSVKIKVLHVSEKENREFWDSLPPLLWKVENTTMHHLILDKIIDKKEIT